MTHESPTMPARRAKLPRIIIHPRLAMRLCGELLDLANTHSKLTRDLEAIEERFEALLALVNGARR
jgi:hypothetical protein